MGLFHRHSGREESRQYVRQTLYELEGVPVAALKDFIAGETIITYKCSACGRRYQDRLVGQVGEFAP